MGGRGVSISQPYYIGLIKRTYEIGLNNLTTTIFNGVSYSNCCIKYMFRVRFYPYILYKNAVFVAINFVVKRNTTLHFLRFQQHKDSLFVNPPPGTKVFRRGCLGSWSCRPSSLPQRPLPTGFAAILLSRSDIYSMIGKD